MNFLITGDTVALINIGNMPPKRFHSQIRNIEKYLNEMGFAVVNYLDFDNEYDCKKKISNFHKCFADNNIRGIFPISDGSFDISFLDTLDYDLINSNSKVICGYSGISALIFMIAYKTKVHTYYGPHLNFINSYSSQRENMFSVYSFWNILQRQAIGRNRMNAIERNNFFMYSFNNEFVFHNIYSSTKDLKHLYINSFCNNEIINGVLYAVTLSIFTEILCRYNIEINEDYVLLLDVFDQSFREIIESISIILNKIDIKKCKCIYISTITQKDNTCINDDLEKENVFLFLNKLHNEVLPNDIDLLYGFPIGHSRYKLTIPTGVKVKIFAKTGEIKITDQGE